MLLALAPQRIDANTYGFMLFSNDSPKRNISCLLLNQGEPIAIKDHLRLAFRLDTRKAPVFGRVVSLQANDGEVISLNFSYSDKTKAFLPGIELNNKVYSVAYPLYAAKPVSDIPAEISLDREHGTVTVKFGQKEKTVSYDFKQKSEVKIYFGNTAAEQVRFDTAPVNVWDVQVDRNHKPLYFWELRNHRASETYDKIEQAVATGTNGRWLNDDHTKWKHVFRTKAGLRTQYAYNAKDNIFYIVDDKQITVFHPATGARETHQVKGHRAMPRSKYLYYNNEDGNLYSYNLTSRRIIKFNFQSWSWDNDEETKDGPFYINHSLSAAPGNMAYAFGGYGFYKFTNKLFRLDFNSGKIEELNYSPKITPRTEMASCVVGDKLYVLGGYGNEEGKQELPVVVYKDLWEINLKTLKARQVYNATNMVDIVFNANMYYSSDRHVFYVGSSTKKLMAVNAEKADWQFITDTLPTLLRGSEPNYNTYINETAGKVYYVVNKDKSGENTELNIFTVDLPLTDGTSAENVPAEQADHYGSLLVRYLIWFASMAIIFGLAYRFYRRKKKTTAAHLPATSIPSASEATAAEATAAEADAGKATPTAVESHEGSTNTSIDKMPTATATEASAPAAPAPAASTSAAPAPAATKPADEGKIEFTTPLPHRSAIYMLGNFQVWDRNGENITTKFTRRTRDLLIIMFLYSKRRQGNIEIRTLDELLWGNMAGDAARNNRSVYISKLRSLLDQVGDMELTNDKISYKLNLSADVFFDYGEALELMDEVDHSDDEDVARRLLQILLQGPLLPSMSIEWLDQFKGNFSSRVITLLNRSLIQAERDGKPGAALQIAQCIMTHDPFNEEAMFAQCRILKRQSLGMAKMVYDKFCQTYEQAMGEPYGVPFSKAVE